MKSILTKLFAIVVVALISQVSVMAQDVRVVNGRLVFPDENAYHRVYDQLQKQVDETPDPLSDVDIKEGERYDDYPALAAFEQSMRGFQSLRSLDLNSEYEQLSKGVEPENIKHSWFSDAIGAALVNRNSVIQIGQVIYILNSYQECIQIINGDEKALGLILQGVNPYTLGDGVKVIVRGGPNGPTDPPTDPCAGFVADFNPSPTFLASNSGNFTYSGSPATSYIWNFGDNTTSTQMNPSKTYTQPGVYIVTLTVMNAQGCSSSTFSAVFVNQLCWPKFKYSKGGAPGVICFDNESTANTPIQSYLWDFGDGTTSTQQNPCHTYTCDKDYTVTLTITSASGCKKTVDKKITVNSYKCCDPDIDEDDTRDRWDYANNRRLKTHANTWDPWIGDDIVSAEIIHYKRVAGIWWRSKANIKVEIVGAMYGPGPTGCHCENPFDVACSDSGNKAHVHAKKTLPSNNQVYKTAKDNPWKAVFYKDGSEFRTCVVPTNCD